MFDVNASLVIIVDPSVLLEDLQTLKHQVFLGLAGILAYLEELHIAGEAASSSISYYY